MRVLFIIYAVLVALMISHNSFASTSNDHSYRYVASDMNIKAVGKTKYEAKENASEECFDRRMDEYEARREALPSDEQGLDIIDSCVNI